MKKFIVLTVIVLLGVANVVHADISYPEEPELQPQPRYIFSHDLSLGTLGADVTALQNLLENYGVLVMPAGVPKGYFGQATKSAVIKYQTSEGILPATGFVGSLTRAKLNGDRTVNKPPVISSFEGPTTLTINQAGTWTIKASDPENNTLRYSISWGENYYSTPLCGSVGNAESCRQADSSEIKQPFGQQTTFTHTYDKWGTYTIYISIYDNAGNEAHASTLVDVTPKPNTVTVDSPNYYAQWEIGTDEEIRWRYGSGMSLSTKVDLYLDGNTCEGICPAIYFEPIVLDKNIQGNSYIWIVGTDIINNPIPAGRYKMKVCLAGTDNCDLSDRAFTLVESAPLHVISPNGGEKWKAGTTHTIRWDSDQDLDSDQVRIRIVSSPQNEVVCRTNNSGQEVCPEVLPSPALLDKKVSDKGSYRWKIPRDAKVAEYSISISGVTNNADGSETAVYDSGDETFTISSN